MNIFDFSEFSNKIISFLKLTKKLGYKPRNIKRLNRLNRKKSKKFRKGKPQSKNYHKARNIYALAHLKVSRQRFEFCKRVALRYIQSNDLVAYEDLNVQGMVRNRRLAKSISDAGWSTFRRWLDYFAYKYGKLAIAVPPHNTSQNCSNCGQKVRSALSTRTHVCPHCGFVADRDVNAGINILQLALRTAVISEVSSDIASSSTVGQTESNKLGEFDPLVSLERSCEIKIGL
ncbi:MAG: RNA-guided endonuclease InsQ/TnpB family protein [Xenococcaceae cyanobacterium]